MQVTKAEKAEKALLTQAMEEEDETQILVKTAVQCLAILVEPARLVMR